MKPGFLRTAALLGSLTIGVFLPQATSFAWVIRWLIMGMLYVVFLQTKVSTAALRLSHAGLLLANVAMGFAGWLLGGWIGGREVALAGFFCAITPTATAAPVIVNFLRGRVEYVIAAFVLTNIIIALLLPALIPLLVGTETPGLFRNVCGSVGFVIFIPLGLAALTRRIYPGATQWPKHLRNVSFGAWVLALFLIMARVSSFLREHPELPRGLLFEIAALSLLLCAANFALGRWIGGKEFGREASQSLGQKNTTFTIYLALMYASPLVALGPTCYVLWHNLWNSWQLHREAQKEASSASS